MNKTLSTIAVAAAIGCASINAEAQTMIGKTTDVAAISKGDRMTPETLWAMGRIGRSSCFARRQDSSLPGGLLQRKAEQEQPDALHRQR